MPFALHCNLNLNKQVPIMKKTILSFVIAAAVAGCSGSQKNESDTAGETPQSMVTETETTASDQGVGKFKDIVLSETIDEAKVSKGRDISDVKCSSCHKLTDEKLVGPGWKGITTRRQPAWILNFITNTDEMLSKDPEAQAQLEICLVRMPNQNLADEDAMSILEYMRKNDKQ